MNEHLKRMIESKWVRLRCAKCGMGSHYEFGIKKAGCEHTPDDLSKVDLDKEDSE